MNSIKKINGKWELWEDGLVFARYNSEREAREALTARQQSHSLEDYRRRQDYLRKTYQQ